MVSREPVTIGLTYTGHAEKHQYYLDWLGAEGAVNIISFSAENNNLDELQHCDALLLSGGRDIHPSLYGSNLLHYSGAPNDGFDKERDLFELNALRRAWDRNLPVLGICRGMQLINVARHGTLVQDLGDEKLNSIHRGGPDKKHELHIEDRTLLAEITGERTGEVNSAHHQAIRQLGEGLMVNARAADGTAEGIEWENKSGKSFLLGVQWHPERMFRFGLSNTPLSKNIRDRFMEEINKSR